MVPFHSLLWRWCQQSWCQLCSLLAAPTKVGVSPALSKGQWLFQVVPGGDRDGITATV